MIENILRSKFKLNAMQEETLELKGHDIVISAPTGSGKTEAILLNIKSGGKYYYFLPTITSCIFMYHRLKDLGVCNVKVSTSVLKEKSYVSGSDITIDIMTPDPIMIGYLSGNRIEASGIILDELDNYPTMVKSVIIDLVNNEKLSHLHYIVASATLDEQLSSNFDNFEHIEYNTDLKITKHVIEVITTDDEVVDIINNNPEKRIGVIKNSISDMEDVMRVLDSNKVKYKYLHSNMTDVERIEAENDLYNGEFKTFISNDIISYSIDVNFDILIMDVSDKLSVNIQRMGRNNRYNEDVKYVNLYLNHPNNSRSLPFIDESKQYEEYDRFASIGYLTYSEMNDIRKEIPFETLPSVDYIVNTYWEKLKSIGIDVNLREVPHQFKIATTVNIKKVDKVTGTVKFEEVDTFRNIRVNGKFPWAWNPYNDEGEKVYVHINRKDYEIYKKENNSFYIRYATGYGRSGVYAARKFYAEGKWGIDECFDAILSSGGIESAISFIEHEMDISDKEMVRFLRRRFTPDELFDRLCRLGEVPDHLELLVELYRGTNKTIEDIIVDTIKRTNDVDYDIYDRWHDLFIGLMFHASMGTFDVFELAAKHAILNKEIAYYVYRRTDDEDRMREIMIKYGRDVSILDGLDDMTF